MPALLNDETVAAEIKVGNWSLEASKSLLRIETHSASLVAAKGQASGCSVLLSNLLAHRLRKIRMIPESGG
jgi:hypothetical protein